MKIIYRLLSFFHKEQSKSTPLVIIKQPKVDSDIKEYSSIEEAISDLESDPNVSAIKIEKLRSSLNQLKNKTSIRIRNGEIV